MGDWAPIPYVFKREPTELGTKLNKLKAINQVMKTKNAKIGNQAVENLEEQIKFHSQAGIIMADMKRMLHQQKMNSLKSQLSHIQNQIQITNTENLEVKQRQHEEYLNTLKTLDDEVCNAKLEKRNIELNGVIENKKEQEQEKQMKILRVLKYDAKFISGKLERLELLISKQTTDSRSFVTFTIDYLRRKCDVILMNISSQRTLTNIGNLVMETIEKLGELDAANDLFMSFLDVFTVDNFQSMEERQLVLQKCKDVQNHWQTIITDLNKL